MRVGMAPREPSLDFASFQAHWANEHGALAGTLAGLRGYVQNHAVLRDGLPLLPYPGFDACSELSFDSLEAMDEAFESDHYRRNVTADEKDMVDKTRFSMMLTERRVLAEGDPGSRAVKLLTFLSADRNAGAGALFETLAEAYRETLRDDGVLRHEQLLVVPGAHDGRIAPMADAVDLLWFADADAALAFLASETAFAGGYALAGRASGAQRLLAHEIRVV